MAKARRDSDPRSINPGKHFYRAKQSRAEHEVQSPRSWRLRDIAIPPGKTASGTRPDAGAPMAAISPRQLPYRLNDGNVHNVSVGPTDAEEAKLSPIHGSLICNHGAG
jgi:hypothetical protein